MAKKPSSTDVELQKLALEREKVELEREKLKVEQFRAWWGGIAVIVPLVAIATTVGLAVWGQYQKAQDDFVLKTAEIIMNTDHPNVTVNKSRALAKLFPGLLPKDFATSFDPNVFTSDESVGIVRSKKELLALLAAKPERQTDIIAFWKSLFPDDKWLPPFEDALAQSSRVKRGRTD